MRLQGKVALVTGSTIYVDGGLMWDYSEQRIRSDESGAGG